MCRQSATVCLVKSPTRQHRAIGPLAERLRALADPRCRRGKRHPFVAVLLIACSAVVTGARSFVAISEWAAEAPQDVLARLGARTATALAVRIPPSGATVRRVIKDTCPGGLADLLGHDPAGTDTLALDGKSARGSRLGATPAAHLLAAMTGIGMTITQLRVPEKTNEITCFAAAVPAPEGSGPVADAFAAGHLGELTKYVPFDLVDAVLAETGRVQKRLRLLPSRVGVYFLLALGLFPHLGYARVWGMLTSALPGAARVSEKALRDVRHRIGPKPVQLLFDTLAVPAADPRTPGLRYRRWRTVAFDGCASLHCPDSGRNRSWLGRAATGRGGFHGYPCLQLMTLVETGTRALLGAVFGPRSTGEITYAARLVDRLDPDMLLLADRAFDGGEFLAAVRTTGAQFLVRMRAGRRLPRLAVLPDGSILTRLGRLDVRVIQAQVTTRLADGTRVTGHYALATSLLDHRTHPATELIALYHERWEIESSYLALRHTLLRGRVLRSMDPAGLEQELWSLLTLYQILRHVMVDAARSRPDLDPDRISFTAAAATAQATVVRAVGIADQHDPAPPRAIATAVLARPLPARSPPAGPGSRLARSSHRSRATPAIHSKNAP